MLKNISITNKCKSLLCFASSTILLISQINVIVKKGKSCLFIHSYHILTYIFNIVIYF